MIGAINTIWAEREEQPTRAAKAAGFEGHNLRNYERNQPEGGTWGLEGGDCTEFKSQKGKTRPKIVTLKRGRKIDEEWLQKGIRPKAAGKRH